MRVAVVGKIVKVVLSVRQVQFFAGQNPIPVSYGSVDSVVVVHAEDPPLEPLADPGFTPLLFRCSLILNVLHQLGVFFSLFEDHLIPVPLLF